ncbi:hypothetical protein EGW08_014129 [Elysia chlorotica]|uniref:tRNA-specific adenosine deaminase 2 n=1 Tax=Elysia chlorotica TaxID=188477 RepID=A0A3S0ZHX6_ELYCH|nr:hypothetical protein EGW08_014129 [Elysia chlorotica]
MHQEDESPHIAWMKTALHLAKKALDQQEVPVGCIIVYSDCIIGTGGNEVNKTKNATRHAEIIAIEEAREFCRREHLDERAVLPGSVLYVTVEPCAMCAGALRQVGVSLVVYGCDNDRFGGCGSVIDVASNPALTASLGPSFDTIKGIFAEEAVDLLKNFYKGENPNAPNKTETVFSLMKKKTFIMSFFTSLGRAVLRKNLPWLEMLKILKRPDLSYSSYCWYKSYWQPCSMTQNMNLVLKFSRTDSVNKHRTTKIQPALSIGRASSDKLFCRQLCESTSTGVSIRWTQQRGGTDGTLTALARQILEATCRRDVRAASVQPHVVVSLLEDLVEAGFSETRAVDLLSGRLWLLENGKAVVAIVESFLRQGFTHQVALDFLAGLPAEICLQQKPLADVPGLIDAGLQQLRDLGFSDGNLSRLVARSPHVLLVSTKTLRAVLSKLKAFFTKADALRVAVTCPEVFSQPWADTSKVFDYAFFTMCYSQPQIAQSGVLACPLHRLQDRHVFLCRAGFFVEVKKKVDPRLNPNPPLRFIVKASDEDFASEFGGLSAEEYSTFLAMRELERGGELAELAGMDTESDSDSDSSSSDSDSDDSDKRR